MSTILSPQVGQDLGNIPCDLRVKSITKHYEGFTLDNVSLDVPRGSIVGLIGQNGAGKTTLMKAILGTIRTDGGNVELFGHDMTTATDSERIALRKRVAFVSAVTAFPAVMSVHEVATMYSLSFPAFDQSAFESLAKRMDLLPENANKMVKDLSRGMGMKLQLACTLASGADLIIMDEPTAGLDPIVREDVLDVLREWMERDNRSILISSHITSDLEKIADYLVLIEQGNVVLTCERDVVSDIMGVAQLRASELEDVLARWPFGSNRKYIIDRGLYKSLLIPDRAAFMAKFPDYACDRANIDEVMVLIVKGEVR